MTRHDPQDRADGALSAQTEDTMTEQIADRPNGATWLMTAPEARGIIRDMEYASTTTLNRIRAASPCHEGWEKLLSSLGKTKADDDPLDLLAILDSNGFDDALWVLSYAMPDDRLARHFQAWCAEQVLHIFEREFPGDPRVRNQIEALKDDTLSAAARVAAWAAAWAAARAAARDAEGDAARAAQERQLRKMLAAS